MSVTELGNQLGNPLAKPSTSGGGSGPYLKLVNEQTDDFVYHLQFGGTGVNIPTGTNWDDMMVTAIGWWERGNISNQDLSLDLFSSNPLSEIGFIMPRDRSLPDSGTNNLEHQGFGQKWRNAHFGTLNYRKQKIGFNYSGKSIELRNTAWEGTSYVYGSVLWRAYDNDCEYNAKTVYFSTTAIGWNDVFGKQYNHGYIYKGAQHYDDGHMSTWFTRGIPKTVNNLRQMNQHSTFNLIFDGDTFVTNTSGSNFYASCYNLIE